VGIIPDVVAAGVQSITPQSGGIGIAGIAPGAVVSSMLATQSGLLSLSGSPPFFFIQGETYASLHFVFKKRKTKY